MKRGNGSALASYAGVGAAATAAHFAFMAVLVEAGGLPAWLASGLGATVGAQVAFFGNRRLTFDHRGAIAPAWRRFMGTAMVGAALGMAIVAIAVALGAHYLLAQALATGLVLIVTFSINRQWTFGPRD